MIVVLIFLAVVVWIGLVGLGLMLAGRRYHGELERYRSRRKPPATLEGGSSHLR